MTTTLIFATNNANKVKEIRSVLGDGFGIIPLKEAGIMVDIPEPFHTLEENASEKSRFIYSLTGKDCFSEDSGLEVHALGGAPGVLSARYAGEDSDSQKNILKLLGEMEGEADRSARFRTVISLHIDGKEHQFEGTCTGQITHEEKGGSGFGYDPIFIPDGSTKTFAEMDMAEKNLFSHRKKATEKFIDYIKRNHGQD
jgi:XTP/dITP diphosphohydrolase